MLVNPNASIYFFLKKNNFHTLVLIVRVFWLSFDLNKKKIMNTFKDTKIVHLSQLSIKPLKLLNDL